MKKLILAAFVVASGLAAPAANIALTNSDTIGNTSFTNKLNWNSASAPGPGNTYNTANFSMRTPADNNSVAFKGDSLTVSNGGFLIYKGGAATVVVTITNLILDGGVVQDAANGGSTFTLAGSNYVASSGTFFGANGNIINNAVLWGSGTIFTTNSALVLNGANGGFTGKIVAGGAAGAGAVAIDSQVRLGGNPATFTADQLTLNNGTLNTTATLALDDPNRGITLGSLGGTFNVNSGTTLTLPNVVAGTGKLIKSGSGTLTLSNVNTYAGGTILTAGTLNINNAAALGTGTFTNGGGTFDNTTGLAISNANNNLQYWTNDLTFTGSNPLNLGTGAVTLTGNRIVTVSANNLTVGGAIGGAFSLNKTGPGTLTVTGNSSYSGGTILTNGTIVMASPTALGAVSQVTLAGGATWDIQTDGGDNLYTANMGSSQTATIASDVKTGSVGINHTLGAFAIGSGTTAVLNIVKGSNVLSGSPKITTGNLTLSAGVGGTTILNPTTADIIIPFITSVSSSKTLQLDGTSAGNQITGTITNGANIVTLVKSNSSTWTLFGTNTYTGNTTIGGGTLALSGNASIATTTNITIGTGAVLDASALSSTFTLAGGQNLFGTGVIKGNATDTAGTKIYPGGNLTVGALSFSNNLTLAGSDTINIDFSNTTNDVIVVGGNLTPSGTTVINLSSYPPFGFVGGDYTLMQVYGSLNGTAANFSLSNVPSPSRLGFSITYDTVSTPKRVLLHVTGSGANLVWTGGLNGNLWDILTTSNWLNGVSSDSFYQGDFVTFDNTGVANSPVTLNTNVLPTAVVVNSTGSYTITGSGKIGGNASLTKTNSGTLVIATTNDYAGLTAINGGTVSIASITNGGVASPLGAASSAPANITFNGGGLQYTGAGDTTDRGATLNAGGATIEVSSSSASLTVGGVIVGSSGGGLTKVGNGTLVLSGANTYDGATTISAGLVQVGAGGASGSLGTGNVANNSALIVNRTGTLTMSNSISGSGSLTNIGAGTLALAATNTYAGQTVISNGVVQVFTAQSLGATPAAYDPAHIQLGAGELEAGISFALADTNSGITTVNGRIGVDAGMTLTVSNTIVGANLTKSRPGTLVLAGSNSLTGTLFVDTASTTGSDGILRITSTNALGGVPDIQIRNNQVPGSSTLQLDGSSGSLTLGQTFEWSGRNNLVAAIENLAGNNTWSPSSVTFNAGGSFYPIFCTAGTLTISSAFPTASPTGSRNVLFGGSGNILVTAGIQSAGSTNLGVVKTNSGTLTLASAHSYNGVSSFQEGTVNLDNASLGVSTANIELAPLTGQTVVVNATNSYVYAQRVVIAGISANNTAPGTGTLNQYGGSLDSYQWFTVGSGGTTGGTGTYNLTDGTLTVRGQQMEVGNFTAASGLVTMNGSSPTINIWSNNYLTLGANANAGNGTFIQNAGTVTLYSDSGGTPGGTGFLYLGRAAGLTNTYTYWLNGGSLSVPAIASTSGTSLFCFNGGTLRPSKTNATFMTGLSAAYVSTNGAIIDGNSVATAIAQPLVHDPALGVAADGGLTMQGSGVVTLSGTNTYTGNTLVNGGSLIVNGAISNSAVTIQGGTLGGNGILYSPATLAYGTIAPGTSIGLLSISNNLTLQGGTLLVEATPSTNDQIAVSGTLNVANPTTIQLSFPTPNVGTYTLITYGTLSGYPNLSLSLSSPNPRFTFTLTNDTTAKAIKLIATGVSAILTWRGDGSFNGWDNGGAYQNWTNSAQGVMDYFYDGDIVTFDNTGSNSPSIYLLSAMTPGRVTVNSANDYDFAGTGYITGVGGLAKSGSGTLILEDNNDYTGATVINGGTIQIGNPNTGGTTGSIGTGALTNNGALVFNRTDSPNFTNDINGTGDFTDIGVSGTLTVSGAISGNTVAKGGAGTLVLSGNNSYTGLTLVTNGILLLHNAAALGTADGGTVATNAGQVYIDQNLSFTNEPFVLGGAALRKGGGGVTTLGGIITLVSNTILQVDGGATLNMTNAAGVTGPGYNLTLNADGGANGVVTGPLYLNGGLLTKGGSGTWTIGPTNYQGVTTNTAGILKITGPESLGIEPGVFTPNQVTIVTSELEATTNIVLNHPNTGITVGQGTIGVDSGMTLVISNSLTVPTTLTKSRPGTLVLAGSNSMSGTLYVDTLSISANDGVLRIASTNAWGGVPDIQIRNNNSGSSTLQLDGSGGALSYSGTFELSGRNNLVPALENVAGSNVWSPSSFTFVSGGALYPISCTAGTLTISGTFPASSPSGTRNIVFGGAGITMVNDTIQSGGSTNLGIVKTNSGTLILAGNNTYNGTTTISGGTLLLSGSIGSTNGVFVSGGTLAGTGIVYDNVTVQSGGTLQPGTTSTIGTLTVASNLTLAGTTAVKVNRSALTSDLVAVTNVTYGGTLAVTNLSGTLNLGDSFTIFSAAARTSTFTSVVGSPGTGKAWSFNPTNGILSVVVGIPTTPTNITVSVSGTNVTVGWPASYTGWILQQQTNSLSVGLGTNWVDVAGSATTNAMTIPIIPVNPTMFFRLRYPTP